MRSSGGFTLLPLRAVLLVVASLYRNEATLAQEVKSHRLRLRMRSLAAALLARRRAGAPGLDVLAESTSATEPMFLKRVSQEQAILLEHLSWMNKELDAATARLDIDMKWAASTKDALDHSNQRIEEARVRSEKTEEALMHSNASRRKVVTELNESDATLTNISNYAANAKDFIDEADVLEDISARADDDHRLLQGVAPAVTKLQHRMNSVEAYLGYGNLRQVTQDATKRALTDVMQDLMRSTYQLLPDPQHE